MPPSTRCSRRTAIRRLTLGGLATRCSRRTAIRRLTLGGLATQAQPRSLSATPPPPSPDPDITFFVVADPQIHLDKWGTAGTEKTLHTLNHLPGSPFPLGGTVDEPRAVLVAGDLVDTVDDPRHWRCYQQFFDPDGRALLRHRAFESIGNHDLSPESATGFSTIQRDVIARNQRRRGTETFHYDRHHYHYSWDWGPLHLVNLNLFPGNQARPVYDREAAWNNPVHSLDFLRQDLHDRVGSSGRPVVLVWHYGLRGWGLEKWWQTADLDALHSALAPYNVVLILHGHEHAYAHYLWQERPVFMCPSPQKDRDPQTPEVASTPKGFLVVRLHHTRLQVAHHDAQGWADTWENTISLGRHH